MYNIYRAYKTSFYIVLIKVIKSEGQTKKGLYWNVGNTRHKVQSEDKQHRNLTIN